jgi:hypothetical protein
VRLREVLRVDGHWLLTGEGGPERPSPDAVQQAFDKIVGVIEEVRKAVPAPREMYRPVPRPPDLENGQDGNGGK